MAKIPYFPFFPDDWLSSSRIDLLTADQERGYLRLLCRSWGMPDCVLTTDEKHLMKWSLLSDANALRTLMPMFFERVERGWRNPKLYSLWLKAQDKHLKASESAKSLWNNKKKESERIANAVQTQSVGNANQNQNQNQKEPKNILSFTPDFESRWNLYPSKDGRKAAEKHFRATVRSEEELADFDTALKKYLEHLRVNDWKKPKNGSTWFNNWQDWISWTEPEGGNGNGKTQQGSGNCNANGGIKPAPGEYVGTGRPPIMVIGEGGKIS